MKRDLSISESECQEWEQGPEVSQVQSINDAFVEMIICLN